MSGARTVRHPPEALTLKVGSRALVRAAGGTDAAGETCGSRQQRMSDCGLANTADFLRIDEVAALEDVTAAHPDAPIVTRLLARRQGYELVQRPDAAPARGDWMAMLCDLARQHGEIAAGIGSALSNDTRIDRDEAAGIRALVAAGLKHLVAMDAALAAIEREGGR